MGNYCFCLMYCEFRHVLLFYVIFYCDLPFFCPLFNSNLHSHSHKGYLHSSDWKGNRGVCLNSLWQPNIQRMSSMCISVSFNLYENFYRSIQVHKEKKRRIFGKFSLFLLFFTFNVYGPSKPFNSSLFGGFRAFTTSVTVS